MSTLGRIRSFYFTTQFVRFLGVGGIALVLHWIARLLFNSVFSYGWSIILAYAVGMLVAFVLNRIYVFPFAEGPLHQQVTWFAAINVAAFPAVWVVAFILGEFVLSAWMPRPLALGIGHGIAICLPAVINFALHKLITFRGA